jgi:hypothetical protein
VKAQACVVLSLALYTVLASCASAPQPRAARYPALAPAAAATPHDPAFEPAATLVSVPLPCRAAELAEPNALDDDCNQRIDDGLDDATPAGDAERDTLVLALAYPQNAPLKLGLRRDAHTLVDLTPSDCGPERSFCTLRVAVRQLSPGRHALVVSAASASAAESAPGAAPATAISASVVVSIQSHGKVTTYLAPVSASATEQVLGQLELP